MNKKRINILVTSVGNPAFPTIVEELRKSADHDYYIVGTDIRKEAPGLYLSDKAYLVSRLSHKNFIDDIFRIMEKEKIDILFPLSTIDQNFFSVNKKRVEERGVKMLVSDPEAIRIANNKYNLYDFLQQKAINPLRYARIVPDSVSRMTDEFEKPFVIKNDEGAGGQGTYIVAETEAGIREDDKKFYLSLANFFKDTSQYIKNGTTIISEYLPGDEYSVDTLSYKGHFFYGVIRKRFKSVGGLALESMVVENEALLELSARIVKEIGLSYINNLQFKVSQSGTYKMMEINPRVPGTIRLSIAAGANIILDAIKLVNGDQDIAAPTLVTGTSFFRYWAGAVATPGQLKSLVNLNQEDAAE